MKKETRAYRNIVAVIGIALLGFGITAAKADSLYIGDANDNTVKKFDASTGQYLGVFVSKNGCPANPPSFPPTGCLYGPRGLIFDGEGHLLVADQNVNLSVSGAIYEYDAQTGTFVKPLVPYTDPCAPFAPQGVVLYSNVLFVASQQGTVTGTSCIPKQPSGTGYVEEFGISKNGTASFLGLLPPPTQAELAASFHPRGVVIANNHLYVSNVPNPPSGNDGQILVYDLTNPENSPSIFASSVAIESTPACGCDLNRPEGLVFGPDGNLYVTSFRASSSDTDKILVFGGPGTSNEGAFIGQIVLDQVGDFRAYAQALLFGPGDKQLFVPITTPMRPFSGQVRVYSKYNGPSDTTLTSYKVFIPTASRQNSPLGSSWFLTFDNTDPGTLDYVSQ
jgi:hypothetical protein